MKLFYQGRQTANYAEIAIMQGSWDNKTYEEIATDTSYSVSYLKQTVRTKLWKILTQALNEAVSKTNFKSALERKWQKQTSRWVTEKQKVIGEFPINVSFSLKGLPNKKMFQN